MEKKKNNPSLSHEMKVYKHLWMERKPVAAITSLTSTRELSLRTWPSFYWPWMGRGEPHTENTPLSSCPFQARQINVWLHYIPGSTVLYWQQHCYQDRENHPLKTKTSYISKSALLQITASTARASAGTAMSVTGHTSSQCSQTELCQQKFTI